MTVRLVIQPRSRIQVKTAVRIPANLIGENGLTVEQSGVDLSVKPDFGALGEETFIEDTETTFVWVWKETEDTYSRVPIDLFAGPGRRYDFPLWVANRPGAGETLIKSVLATNLYMDVGLPESRAEADTVATGSSVFSLQKNSVQFGTVTFGAGSGVGTLASASGAEFVPGDDFGIVAPNPRDATLANIKITIVGYRTG